MKSVKSVRTLCVAVGACLIVCAAISFAAWRIGIARNAEKAESYASALLELIPEPKEAPIEERRDNTMSALSVDGTDFVGIIEMPQYGAALPVGASWGRVSRYPCLFDGSIYDGSLKIGATAEKGQFDFYRSLSLGDTVIYTDTEGNRYTLEISAIRSARHANKDALSREEAPLTLFIKNVYSFEYLIVFCDTAY